MSMTGASRARPGDRPCIPYVFAVFEKKVFVRVVWGREWSPRRHGPPAVRGRNRPKSHSAARPPAARGVSRSAGGGGAGLVKRASALAC